MPNRTRTHWRILQTLRPNTANRMPMQSGGTNPTTHQARMQNPPAAQTHNRLRKTHPMGATDRDLQGDKQINNIHRTLERSNAFDKQEHIQDANTNKRD